MNVGIMPFVLHDIVWKRFFSFEKGLSTCHRKALHVVKIWEVFKLNVFGGVFLIVMNLL